MFRKCLMVRHGTRDRKSRFAIMVFMDWHIFKLGSTKPVLTVKARHQPAALLAAYKKLGGTAGEQRLFYARPKK